MDNCKSSGLKTSSAKIFTGRGVLIGAAVITDGSNPGTLTVYDAETATSTELLKVLVPAAVGSQVILFPNPVRCNTALYAAISGTGAAFILYYDNR